MLEVSVDPISQISPPFPQISLPSPQIEESIPYDFPAGDYASSSNCPSPTPSLFTMDLINTSTPNLHLDDLSTENPPSSAFPSENSSAQASDAELPHSSSIKATKQTGLLNFFSKVPSEELHARWRKRKRDNEDRDKERYEERKRKDEEDKSHKKARRREQLRAAQSKRRNKLKEAAILESKNVIEQDSSVSLLFI